MEQLSLYQTILREAITWPLHLLQGQTSGSIRFESRVPAMAAWCRELEEQLLHTSVPPTVYVGIERASYLSEGVARRYEALARDGGRITVLALLDDPAVAARFPLLDFVPLPAEHPLVGEWFVVADGPEYPILFSAREKHRWPDRRTFVGVMTDSRDLVAEARRLLEGLVRSAAPTPT